MKTNVRIEILNPVTGVRLECKNVKELKPVFLYSNIIYYYITTNERCLTFEQKNRVEIGTPQLNFVFNADERTIEEEIEFMKKSIIELQKLSINWFDKRTKEYKHAFSFENGFTAPLVFKEIK